MSLATDLQTVYDNLNAVLTDCNTALTGKGGAEAEALAGVAAAITALPSGGGGLPTLDNPAAESDVLEGKEYIDQSGQKKVGTLGTPLPDGIEEYEVQFFTPEADTNEELSFSLNMTDVPTHIMIAADFPSVVSRSFVEYTGSIPTEDSDGTMFMLGCFRYCTVSVFEKSLLNSASSGSSNRCGLYNLTNKGFTFRGNYYGGQFNYFRAGYTYTIIAMRIKTQ